MTLKDKHTASQKSVNKQHLLDKDMQKLHKESLGFEVPENYFPNSKQDILAQITGKKERSRTFLKPNVIWYAAASIVLLIAITVIKSKDPIQIDDNNTIVSDTIKSLKKQIIDREIPENDVLVSSLFVEENDVDAFIDDYVLDKTLTDETL